MNIKSNIRPLTYAAIKSKVSRKVETLTGVDLVIHEVNRVMGDTQLRDSCRCDPKVGSFWSVSGNAPLTKTDTARVRKSFIEAGWPKVHVVFWQGRWSVTLSEDRWQQFGKAVHNGESVPLYYARGPKSATPLPRGVSTQRARRTFAFQR